MQSVKRQSEGNKTGEYIPQGMNAVLFYGPGDIRYEQIPTPKINENEILVKINTVLTGGTDLKTFKRGHPVLIKKTPSLFGHQFSGEIVKTGKNVKNFSRGQRVVSLNSAPCFECHFCKIKRFSLCENIEFLNGAYAEYIAVPERIVKHNTYVIPKGVSFTTAAILESLAVVLHGLDISGVEKDKTVCIIGTGSIGLLFTAVSKYLGAKVISVGRNEFKLSTAKELGADCIFNMKEFSEENLIKEINSATEKLGPEIVIEAVGLPEMWELSTRIVRRGGTVNFFGGCKKETKVEIDTFKLHYDELKLIGVFHHTPEYAKKAMNMLSASFMNRGVNKIVTHSLPLAQLKKAFEMQEAGEAIQIAIQP